MAAFNYTGMAKISWTNPAKTTEQYIDYCADSGTLRVWPEDDSIPDYDYLGLMKDHPAESIKFLHRS